MATSLSDISFDSEQLADVDVDSLNIPVDDVAALSSTDSAATDGSLTYRRGAVQAASGSAVSGEPLLAYLRGRGWKEGGQALAVPGDSHTLYRTIELDAGMLGPNLDLTDWDLDALGGLSFDDFDFSMLNPVQTGEQVSVTYGVVIAPLFTGRALQSAEDVKNIYAVIPRPYSGFAATSESVEYFRSRACLLAEILGAPVEDVTACLKTWVWSPYDAKDTNIWTRYERPTQDIYEATK